MYFKYALCLVIPLSQVFFEQNAIIIISVVLRGALADNVSFLV